MPTGAQSLLGAAGRADAVLALQHTAGNRAVARMLSRSPVPARWLARQGKGQPPAAAVPVADDGADLPDIELESDDEMQIESLLVDGVAVGEIEWVFGDHRVHTGVERVGPRHLVVKLEIDGGTFELWEYMPAPDGWTIEVWTKDTRPPLQELAPRPSWEHAGTLYDAATQKRRAAEEAARARDRAIRKAILDGDYDKLPKLLAGMSRSEQARYLEALSTMNLQRLRDSLVPGGTIDVGTLIETVDSMLEIRDNALNAENAGRLDDAVTSHLWSDAASRLGSFDDAELDKLLAEFDQSQLRHLANGANRLLPGDRQRLRGHLDKFLKPPGPPDWNDRTVGRIEQRELKAVKREELSYESMAGAASYAQSLKVAAAVVMEGGFATVYRLGDSDLKWWDVRQVDQISTIFPSAGVLAIVLADGQVLEPFDNGSGPQTGSYMVVHTGAGLQGDPFAGHKEAFGVGLDEAAGKDAFLAQFEVAMKDTAYTLLDYSRAEARGKYRDLASGVPAADRPAMEKVLENVAVIDAKIAKEESAISAASADARGATMDEAAKPIPGMGQIKAAAVSRRQSAEARKAALETERRQAFRGYPLLSYVDDLPAFAALGDAGQAAQLRDAATKVQLNCNKVVSWISDGSLDLWALDQIVEATKRGLGVKSALAADWIKERHESAKFVKTLIDIAMGVLAVGLGIAAGIVGGPVGVALAIGAVGVGVADAVRTTDEYLTGQTTSQTAINRYDSLLDPDEAPHWGWVVVAWVGVGLDALDALKAAKALSKGAALEKVAADMAKAHGVPADKLVRAARGAGQKAADAKTLEKLLHGLLPPDVVKKLGKVPVEVVTDDEFVRQFGSRTGSAVTLIDKAPNGDLTAKVIFRESGNPLALREEAIHVRQLADPKLRPEMAKLAESDLARWASMSLDEQLALYRTKIAIEQKAAQQLVAELAKEGNPKWLAEAQGSLEALDKRLAELDGVIKDPGLIKAGKASWWDAGQAPRLFNKSRKLKIPELPAKLTAAQGKRARKLLSTVAPEHQEGLVKALKDEPDVDGLLDDLEAFFDDKRRDAAIDKAFARLERGEIDQEEAKLIRGSKRGAAGAVPDVGRGKNALAPGQRITRDLMKKVRKVLGLSIKDAEKSVLECWEKARKEVLAANPGPKTRELYNKKLYPDTRGKFWKNVRGDPKARAWFERQGFWFPDTSEGAPLVAAAKQFPGQEKEFLVSLDHVAPKATGDNWKKALDADNLKFVIFWDNWLLALIERKLPEFAR